MSKDQKPKKVTICLPDFVLSMIRTRTKKKRGYVVDYVKPAILAAAQNRPAKNAEPLWIAITLWGYDLDFLVTPLVGNHGIVYVVLDLVDENFARPTQPKQQVLSLHGDTK